METHWLKRIGSIVDLTAHPTDGAGAGIGSSLTSIYYNGPFGVVGGLGKAKTYNVARRGDQRQEQYRQRWTPVACPDGIDSKGRKRYG